MKQFEQDYTKEPFSEKLRQHTMDILVLFVCVPLMFFIIKNKHDHQTHQNINTVKQDMQSVPDIKQKSAINFTDTIYQKQK